MKNYQKAVDQGKELEDGRQNAPALEKYSKARSLFDPPLLLPALRVGLCRCHLRARNGVEAVAACKVAHEALTLPLPLTLPYPYPYPYPYP